VPHEFLCAFRVEAGDPVVVDVPQPAEYHS